MTTVRVERSAVIPAAIDVVWPLLRDFNGHALWHPLIAESRMEDGADGDQVGGVRAFRLTDGSFLRERLIAHSDRDRAFSYCLIEAPLPLHGYVADLRLRPVTSDDTTFLTWRSSFDPPAERAWELARLVGEGVYGAGIAALVSRFADPEPPRKIP